MIGWGAPGETAGPRNARLRRDPPPGRGHGHGVFECLAHLAIKLQSQGTLTLFALGLANVKLYEFYFAETGYLTQISKDGVNQYFLNS